jgi:solute carrier family 45 protein 1/2/4
MTRSPNSSPSRLFPRPLDPRASFDSADDSTPIRTPSRSGSSDPDRPNDSPDLPPAKWRSTGGSSRPLRDDFENDRAEDVRHPDPAAPELELELGSPEMANWTGQPSIRGSTEAIRMVLLSFCSIGIT